MSKYLPLSERLARETADQWRPTLAEIEAVLGFPLPKAAQQAAWWGGASDKPHHRAWLDQGWRAGDLDRAAGTVTFHRDATAGLPKVVEAPPVIEAQRGVGGLALIGAGVAVIAGIGLFAARLMKRRKT
ncbi:MAG: hypothetical protein V4759_15200 [Pseudomonadota bacterium]